jgi:hypothetical protein
MDQRNNPFHPVPISQVTRLDQAQDHQREAIAFVADLPHEAITVSVRAVLDPAPTPATSITHQRPSRGAVAVCVLMSTTPS